MTRVLHFTIGPVQGFIADARRTRDLWAGSFLLSWLAGHAMAALVKESKQDADKVIVFPSVKGDDLFEAIKSFQDGSGVLSSPYIGSLPNRFKADISHILDTVEGKCRAAEICRKAVEDAWGRLEGAVWDQFINEVAPKGSGTKKIWDRQVNQFWDISWVAGEPETPGEDVAWLDQRKNWRSHFPGALGDGSVCVEDGDLCRLMGHYQEISGFSRIKERDDQVKFYKQLREQTYCHEGYDGRRKLGELNIGETERLCAIALIKRLFPLLDEIEDVIGWRPGGKTLNVINWPSVSYVAAVPWLKAISVNETLKHEAAGFAALSGDEIGRGLYGETDTKLFGLPKSALFFRLDGHLLHEDGIRAWKQEGVNTGKLLEEYGRLVSKISKETASKSGPKVKAKPSEFYSILLMDGDSIGARMREAPEIVKDGLARFTERVKAYFDPWGAEKNPANGVLIYAGGDDILALLPVDTAIEAAKAMREAYRLSFEEAIVGGGTKADAAVFTLSGALVFAQYKIPLRAVLEEAHKQLDKVAKEQNGRDSLALAAFKPGGVASSWVSCWRGDEIASMESIARDRSDFSSSFFYNLRERYGSLFVSHDLEDGQVKEVTFDKPDLMEAVLVAEYKKQPKLSKISSEEALTKTKPLISIGYPQERQNGVVKKSGVFQFEGALVARFLAEEGRWALLKPAAAEKNEEQA